MFGYGLLHDPPAPIAVQHWLSTRFSWDIDTAWVSYAGAVVPALVNAIQALTEEGDQVLIQSPIYMPFHTIINSCGREKVVTSMFLDEKDGVWKMDFKDIEEKCKDPKLKIFMLCNPHNPLGRVFSRAELLELGRICLENNVIILSDEIHFDLVYPTSPQKHICFPTLSPELSDISIVFINPSKIFNVPGLRCATTICPNPDLKSKIDAQAYRNKTGMSNLFGVVALAAAYLESAYYADQVVEYLSGNLELTMDFFAKRIPQIKLTRPEATYLLWLDCRALGFHSGKELEKWFLEEVKLALNEGTTFGPEGEGFMRINIACRRSTLEEALERIERAVKKLEEGRK